MSEQTKTHIGPRPPQDGGEWGCQCARCGSSCEYNRKVEEWMNQQ